MPYLKTSLFVAALAVGLIAPAAVGTTPAATYGTPVIAHADSTFITSGTIGQDCHWALTNDGKTLTLSGKNATLPNGSPNFAVSPIEALIDAEQDPGQQNYSAEFHADQVTKLVLQDPMNTGTDASSLFSGFMRVDKIDGLENLNTTAATTMNSMFDNDQYLTDLDLSHFDTHNVTDMSSMFSDDELLPSLDLSHLNTKQVTNMSYMFDSDFKLTNLTLGANFDTHGVTDMSYMFSSDARLTNVDLSMFDTSSVTNMHRMFYDDSVLATLDLSHFATPAVTDMGEMFNSDPALTSLTLGTGFDTQNVTTMNHMFAGDTVLASLDTSHFVTTSKLTDTSFMFDGDAALTKLDLSHFDTSNVTDMDHMFDGDAALTQLDLGSFDTSNVTDMSNMFAGTTKLSDLNIANFTTAQVAQFGSMFNGAASLTQLDLSKFVTTGVVAVSYMVGGTGMSNMFAGMTALKRLNIANFDSRVFSTAEYLGEDATTDHLFQGDNQLTELTLGPNTQFLLGLNAGYQGDPDTNHSPDLPAITPSTTYTGKWRAVAGGTLTAPAGKTAYSSDDLVKLYSGENRPTAATTYVWEPLVTLGQPVTIHYVDEQGKSIHATRELSGNVGSSYTITPDSLPDYEFVKASQGALKGTYSAKPQQVTLVYHSTATTPSSDTSSSSSSSNNTSSSSTSSSNSSSSNSSSSNTSSNNTSFNNTSSNSTSSNSTSSNSTSSNSTSSNSTSSNSTSSNNATSTSNANATSTSNTTGTSNANSTSSITSSSTPNVTIPVTKKGQTITAVKKLALYRTPNFSQHTRKFYYAQRPRTKRPQFIITGIAQSRAGHKRYLVRDVTPNAKRKGQTGYLTAKSGFTVNTYYQHAPKRVELLSGTNAYREVALKHRVKHFKRGQVLRVKKLVNYHSTTRLVLTNGTYITGNKAQVLAK
ncbi:BspA family leucine-rich repeat surface protein [Levilactobacillus acidifarinae]|uniref:DUF5776 domain-containing protein n=1 Tax=Levilactobacillus acidifarinae DSM 19394 = JCM 15949 TaxID=1423715 RepID=A0A0R1LK44_9LACO|nr:BspA family leucine-rich repeat surface protein [Levilactobacillus acidifarinae]KRK95944.1 hypothetical protein FD25_GL002405 [Levilactobacillus acidifarinae DSM 19394]GEO69250.1 hypothetical protein LAC03_11600 [Levilactobacillus acidifarinae]